MKKLLALVLVGIMTFAIVGCSSSDTGSGTKLETIKDKKVLSVYMDPNFPPFEYMGSNREITGVDAEIAKAIAAELGAKADLSSADFDSIIMSLKSGKGDIGISGITIRDDRKENVDFSDPYIKSVQYLILAEDSEIAYLEDLAGKTVGVALGYTGQFLMEDELAKDEEEGTQGVLYGKNTVIREYKSAMEGAQDVGNRVDAVVMDEYVAKNIVSNNSNLKAIELRYKDGTLAEEEYGVAVAKGNEDLLVVINKVINELKQQGKIEQWVVQFAEDYIAS